MKFCAVLMLCGPLFGASTPSLSVRLLSNLPSPQPVGTVIGLMPHLEHPAKGMHVFRYSVSIDGGPLHVIRDFSQQRNFEWAPSLYEHEARIHLTVRNNDTKDSAEADLPFRITSRVAGNFPVVTPTAHPLIALVSAPPCAEGSQFRVAFQRQGDSEITRTPAEPCRASRSNNVYVAGMRPETSYQFTTEVIDGRIVHTSSPHGMTFRTGMTDGDFPPVSIPTPRASGTASEPVLVQVIEGRGENKRPFATDLDGNLIWYLSSPGIVYRILPGGRFLVQAEGANSANDIRRAQILREADLAGNTLHETNVSRIAEQLERFGIHSDCKTAGKECVSGFHHDAIRIPNGHTLAIAGLERMMPAGTQGSKEPVDILGDIVVDLDEDFQVAHVWNSFDSMDLNRKSLADAHCNGGPGSGGCPPIFLAARANGWLHSNALNYIPESGDFLDSVPEQNWVVKIDYRDGKGTGKVLWRLGEGGDFTAITSDPHPWFSYQHDSGFDPPGSNLLSIVDNGHARHDKDPNAHSRGQVWKLDEAKHTAELVVNADLGVYSGAVGDAQQLSNGNYAFDAGFINPDSFTSQSVETTPGGHVVYVQQNEGYITYRSFRLKDLYSASQK